MSALDPVDAAAAWMLSTHVPARGPGKASIGLGAWISNILFLRNALALVLKSAQQLVAATIRTVFA